MKITKGAKWLTGTAIAVIGLGITGWGTWSAGKHEQPSQQAITGAGPAVNNVGGTVTLNINGGDTSGRQLVVVRGDYSICGAQSHYPSSDARFLDFLYDIWTNRDKVLFLDVDVLSYCASQYGTGHALFKRTATKATLTYRFEHLDAVDGARDLGAPAVRYMVPDNGTSVTIEADATGVNQFSTLNIYDEGMEDQLYGPYIVKQSGEDGETTLTLYPALLNAEEYAQAKALDTRLKAN